MSINMMREVIRISDRFTGRDSIDSIDRQGRLLSVIVAVFIFHAIMGIAFSKMEEFQKSRPRRAVSEVAFSYQMNFVPPEPIVLHRPDVPLAPQLTTGLTSSSGGTSAPAQRGEKVTTAPVTNLPDEHETPAPVSAASSLVDHHIPVAPPIAINKPTDVRPNSVSIEAAPAQGFQTGAFSTALASGAPFNGGSPSLDQSSQGATGPGGIGAGGTGKGTDTVGSGDDNAPVGGQVISYEPPPVLVTRGNIAPYKKKLLLSLAQSWHAPRNFSGLVLLLSIGQDGKLVGCDVLRTSGKEKWDRDAIDAIEATELPPLPDWYKGQSLPVRLELSALLH